jgi:hypothetical protein
LNSGDQRLWEGAHHERGHLFSESECVNEGFAGFAGGIFVDEIQEHI